MIMFWGDGKDAYNQRSVMTIPSFLSVAGVICYWAICLVGATLNLSGSYKINF